MAWGDDLTSSQVNPAGSRPLWLLMGFLSAGYVSLVSHSVNVFIPALMVLWFLLRPQPFFKGISPAWFAISLGLTLIVFLSAVFGTHSGIRSLGFAAFSTLPLLGLALVPEPRLKPAILDYFIATAIGMLVWNMIFFGFLGGSLGPWQSWNPAGTGNTYGIHLNMIWPVFFFAARHETNADRASAFYILALLCLVFAVLTFSRAAIGSAIISSVLIVLYTKGVRAVIGGAVVIMVVFLLAHSQVVRLLEYARLVNFTPDLGRFKIWTLAWQRTLENPLFGVAPGGVPAELAAIDVYHAHNSLLNTALESGLLAGGMTALIFGILALWALRLFQSAGASPGYACAILAYLSSSIVSTTTSSPELTFSLVLVVAASRLTCLPRRVAVR